jgi:hypothetical protein
MVTAATGVADALLGDVSGFDVLSLGLVDEGNVNVGVPSAGEGRSATERRGGGA